MTKRQAPRIGKQLAIAFKCYLNNISDQNQPKEVQYKGVTSNKGVLVLEFQVSCVPPVNINRCELVLDAVEISKEITRLLPNYHITSVIANISCRSIVFVAKELGGIGQCKVVIS